MRYFKGDVGTRNQNRRTLGIGEPQIDITAQKFVCHAVNSVGKGAQQPVVQQLIVPVGEGEKVPQAEINS